MFHHYFAFFGKRFSDLSQNYNPKPSKRSQVQIWNVHKPWKIGIATRAKRSAVIPTAQKDPPLSHKGVDLERSRCPFLMFGPVISGKYYHRPMFFVLD